MQRFLCRGSLGYEEARCEEWGASDPVLTVNVDLFSLGESFIHPHDANSKVWLRQLARVRRGDTEVGDAVLCQHYLVICSLFAAISNRGDAHAPEPGNVPRVDCSANG